MSTAARARRVVVSRDAPACRDRRIVRVRCNRDERGSLERAPMRSGRLTWWAAGPPSHPGHPRPRPRRSVPAVRGLGRNLAGDANAGRPGDPVHRGRRGIGARAGVGAGVRLGPRRPRGAPGPGRRTGRPRPAAPGGGGGREAFAGPPHRAHRCGPRGPAAGDPGAEGDRRRGAPRPPRARPRLRRGRARAARPATPAPRRRSSRRSPTTRSIPWGWNGGARS